MFPIPSPSLFPALGRDVSVTDWLRGSHVFNFSGFYRPGYDGFGKLLVFNDDQIKAGKGFPTHSHRDMEIVTLVTKGTVEHRDSTGATGRISTGQVQYMAAGSGVAHSEFATAEADVELFQIWIRPRTIGGAPRYAQAPSPWGDSVFRDAVNGDGSGGALTLNQDARVALGSFPRGGTLKLTPRTPSNGLFLFLAEGSATFAGAQLGRRDAAGLLSAGDFIAQPGTLAILIEVPI